MRPSVRDSRTSGSWGTLISRAGRNTTRFPKCTHRSDSSQSRQRSGAAAFSQQFQLMASHFLNSFCRRSARKSSPPHSKWRVFENVSRHHRIGTCDLLTCKAVRSAEKHHREPWWLVVGLRHPRRPRRNPGLSEGNFRGAFLNGIFNHLHSCPAKPVVAGFNANALQLGFLLRRSCIFIFKLSWRCRLS